MGKKYFTGFCNMNSRDLRSNPFHHSCLVLFEGDTDEDDNLLMPLRVTDSYGFYSHSIPGKKSLFEDPVAFFSQGAGFTFRLRGSYGEWKREAIHDLSYGRGLSGRLFEMSADQVAMLIQQVNDKIILQQTLLPATKSIEEHEEMYATYIANQVIQLMRDGVSHHAAHEKARKEMPLSEFKYSLTGNGYTCKIAALDAIASCYPEDMQAIHQYIAKLKGSTVTHSIPRMTPDLEDIVIHAVTDEWQARGKTAKFPFYDWEMAKTNEQFKMIAVDIGSGYIDKQGDYREIPSLNAASREVVKDLKTIGRLCEIYIDEPEFKSWHKKVCHYLHNLATCETEHQQTIRTDYAKRFISQLMNDQKSRETIEVKTPENLKKHVSDVLNKYDEAYDPDEEIRLYSYLSI